MSEQSNQTDRISARNADPAPASPAAPGTGAASPERRKSTRWRKMLLGAIGVLILAGACGSAFPGSRQPSTRFQRMTHTSTVTSRSWPPASGARSRACSSTTTTACARETFSSYWTRSPFRSQSRSKRRLSIRRQPTWRRRKPKRAVSKRRPGAGAGRCSTPSRTSTTRSPCCAPGWPVSTRARPSSRWLSLTSTGPPSWW